MKNLFRAGVILATLVGLSACVSTGVKPEDCPAGTQKLPDCPPLAAVSDAEILDLYESRTWIDPDDLEEDAVEYARDAKIPINQSGAKFIGSTTEGALTSLAAKLHMIEQAEYTIDLVYYIYKEDLVGFGVLGALCEAIERGVDVRFMIDSIGSSGLGRKYIKALESCTVNGGFMRNEAGEVTVHKARVQAVLFNAASKIFVNHNRRSHDKLLVTDGWFPDKTFVMTGGRNISLAYYGVMPDGSYNPDTYRDAEILLRGGESEGESRETVGSVSEIYYTLLFLYKNNKIVEMSGSDPENKYAEERQLFKDSLAQLKAMPRLKEYLDKMPEYFSSGFHDADVLLAHELANMTDRKVINNAVENAELNPNSIMTIFAKVRDTPYENMLVVSPYMFGAKYKDKDKNVVLDDAKNMLQWLEDNPDSTITLVTNSVLTGDNFFTQAVIDMNLAPRLLLSEEFQEAWLEKPEESELNPELVESDEWVSMINHPRLFFLETGRLDDIRFGGDHDHSKLHAKYTLSDNEGFVGTTNFDYRSRLYNNEMGFFFESEGLADEIRENTEYLIGLSYRWGSPEWLEMRKTMMGQDDSKASTTRKQRGLYKTLKNTGLQWIF